MNLNEIIRKRKSIRKYDPAPLDAAVMEALRAQIAKVKPLYPGIGYSIEFVSKTKGLFNVKAPHYLVFGSEEMDGACENIGFIGQQLDLYFSGAGLGSCWLGVSKPEAGLSTALPFVASMSFGKPAEPLHRAVSDFRRKKLSEICEGSDERLEAARLAPSGMNNQNWYFVAGNGCIHCYRKKTLLSFTSRMGRIDMGIALCHIAVGSDDFCFAKEADAPGRRGSSYVGTVLGG